jgi:non-canonical purine NTP pyrophosphatase (RdgB/HAM1 family)
MSRAIPVVLASANPGKAKEFDRLLSPVFEVKGIPEDIGLPEETGDTFVANARLKARAVFVALGGKSAVLADDSGLEVAALGGFPGVTSARYAGEEATDADNVARLLRELEGRVDRAARFVCCLVLMLPASTGARGGSREISVEAYSNGSITTAPRGEAGFGYDPVFLPDGWHQTLAEADPAQKDRVSHRGAAARLLVERTENGLEDMPAEDHADGS